MQDTGFSANVLVLTTSYPDECVGHTLEQRISATVRGLQLVPGVEAAGALIGQMLNRRLIFGGVTIRGEAVAATPKAVTPEYFVAAGTRLIAGRTLTAEDRNRSAIVINESLARRYWPDGLPVGKSVSLGGTSVSEVVGVVSDNLDVALDRRPVATVFSLLENPSGCTGDCNDVSYLVRGQRSPEELRALAVRTVERLNEDAVVTETGTVAERLGESVQDRAFAALVLVLFAGACAGVSVAGVVGIVAFVVTRRTHEIALRVAIGATPVRVLRLVLGEVVAAAAAGVVVGGVAAHWGSRALEHLLYQVKVGDWGTVFVASLAMMGATMAAAAVPVLRALRIPPSSALRQG
jgi:ABC-type antimicrobial peptide transport system permease subunit